MTWVAVGVGAATLISNVVGNNKAKKAQEKAAKQQLSIQQAQYAQQQANMQPYLQSGQNALAKTNAVMNGDYSGFENSPQYQYALQQGLQGVDRSAAAKGSLYSGGQQADIVNYAQGLASQNLNNYLSQLNGMSNQGYSAANSANNSSQNYANGATSVYGSIGNAQAQAAASNANSINSGLSTIGYGLNNYLGATQAQTTSSYSGGGMPLAGTNGSYDSGNINDPFSASNPNVQQSIASYNYKMPSNMLASTNYKF